MSRIGNKKISIPKDVVITCAASFVSVKNNKGEKKIYLPKNLSTEVSEGFVKIVRINDAKESKSLHGTFSKHIENAIIGLTEGFTKKLEFKGVGFTVASADGKIVMRLGFSHQIEIPIPDDISVSVQKNVIVVQGDSKESVGLFAAKIRETKKPEVYKGKGIRYQDEVIRKKAGKTAQSSS